MNYGAIGAVIGHEIGHGFDDQGRKFGPDGALQDWWTPKDAEVFSGAHRAAHQGVLGFEALPGLKVNGANTIGENIGDLGGLNMAHEAYRISLQGPAGAGDRRAERRSALLPRLGAGVAQQVPRRARCASWSCRTCTARDYFRVNGPLPNIDAWYSAFDVQPGDKLYIAPAERVRIW